MTPWNDDLSGRRRERDREYVRLMEESQALPPEDGDLYRRCLYAGKRALDRLDPDCKYMMTGSVADDVFGDWRANHRPPPEGWSSKWPTTGYLLDVATRFVSDRNRARALWYQDDLLEERADEPADWGDEHPADAARSKIRQIYDALPRSLKRLVRFIVLYRLDWRNPAHKALIAARFRLKNVHVLDGMMHKIRQIAATLF